MLNIRENVDEFLKKTQMDYESIDIARNCERFITEMKNGLCGDESSLRMIPTYLSVGGDIPHGEPVIVLDAGGTNFRVAVLKFDINGKPQVDNYKKYRMPGVDTEISSDDFFDIIATYIIPVIDKANKIGFCFSYAAEPTVDMDGKVIEMGKQLKVKGLIGKKIGQCLAHSLKNHGVSCDKSIVVLNDSVATLLGGRALSGDRKFDGYLGFILGTGTNTCYVENIENIKKLSENHENSMIINIETGGYTKFRRGVIDKEYDEETIDPGHSSYEKMISGRYQGDLMLAILYVAASQNIFSEYFGKYLKCNIKLLTALEIDSFLYYPYGDNKLAECCGNSESDRITLYYLIDALVERAAKLVMINLASVMMITKTGSNPCKPVCITAEGSTFYNSKLFKSKLDYYIKKYLNDDMHLYCEIVRAENATLVGTAIAALVN